MQATTNIQKFNTPKELINQSHFPSIDGLRAISIIIVILCHINFDGPLLKYFDGGVGVQIFFVISGFLITTLLLKEKAKNGTVSLKSFYIRRALRIIPVALLFIVTLMVLNHIFLLDVSKSDFILSLLYLKNLPVKTVHEWYTGHFWSLSIEEQFYLLFPVFLVWNVNKAKVGTILMILLIPLITYLGFVPIQLFAHHTIHTVIFLVVNLFGEGTTSILTGCLFAILLFNGFFKKLPNAKWVSIVIFIVALSLRLKISPLFIPYIGSVIFDFLIAFVIILNLNPNNHFARFLNTPVMVKLGILSYSLYIWQQIFTNRQPWAHLFKYADSLWLNIPALFIVAYLSYHFYEKKFLKLKDRFSKSL